PAQGTEHDRLALHREIGSSRLRIPSRSAALGTGRLQGTASQPVKPEYDGIAGLEVRAGRHAQLLGLPAPPFITHLQSVTEVLHCRAVLQASPWTILTICRPAAAAASSGNSTRWRRHALWSQTSPRWRKNRGFPASCCSGAVAGRSSMSTVSRPASSFTP